MLRVGWLADTSNVIGGAELTARAFYQQAPKGMAVMPCRPGQPWPDVDVFVVHNCVSYGDVSERFGRAPVVKYHHDVGPHLNPILRDWLYGSAENVFCSYAQYSAMAFRDMAAGGEGINRVHLCPPAMDLLPFICAAPEANTYTGPAPERSGTVWIGNMLNHGKGIRHACEWAERNQTRVKFYGDGPLRPQESEWVADCGPIAYEDVPALLGRSERLVFIPTALEPFGRVVAEAWAAGCQVVTNNLVGAKAWIENDPGALETAAEEFWRLVEGAAA